MSPNNGSNSSSPAAAANEPTTDETVQFLSNKALDPEVQIVESKTKSQDESRSKRCACCTLKCSMVGVGVAVVVILLVLAGGYYRYSSRLTGTASSKDSAQWNKALYSASGDPIPLRNISGIYELVSFDDTYDAYLMAMGTPSLVLGLVKASAERLFIKAPDADESWLWEKKTDTSESEMRFTLGTEFVSVWGRNKGDLHNECRMSEENSNVLLCTAEEKKRKWNIEHEYTFSNKGLVDSIRFRSESKDVRTKKYYKKTSLDEIAAEEARMDSESPFGNDDGDDLNEGDEDFMNFDSNDEDDNGGWKR